MTTKIVLHGDLADFGEEWNLDVHSPAEAVRAINANSPGFLDRLQSGTYSILVVPLDKEVTHEDQVTVVTDATLELPVSDKESLHFIPVTEGDAFTAAAWVYFAIGSSGIAGATVIAAIAAVAVFAAITFAMITIADMLMPSPPGIDTKKSDPSHAFSGPVNTSKQGGVVPVLYGGPLLVGSQVIGHSIVTEDLSTIKKNDGDPFFKLKSKAYAEIVDVISEGEIEGFAGADLDSSIYFDDVPAKLGGRTQFEGFDVAYTTGTQGQVASDLNIATNPSSSSVHSVNTLVKQANGPLTRTTQDLNVGSITFTINFPALFKTRRSSDNVRPQTVGYTFLIKGGGKPSYVVLESLSLKGKAKEGFYKDYTYSINPSQHGTPPYFIQVRRDKADSDDDTVHDELYWTTWAEHVKSNLSYPNSSYAVTKLNSEYFPTLPTRGFLMKGLKIRIPSNYDPINRTYSGSWDGTFSPTLQWTNNPAWIFYDLATHPRYGLGQYMDDTLIDKWALYTIAQYCDELVDDGYGGQEPRFVCNMYLQNSGEALTVLRDLASAFRSIMFWAGELKVHQDSPSPTQAQFTPSNVINGDFTYSGTPKHLRKTVALVTWINPEDNYNAWIEYVEDEEGIRLYGVNETSITAVGCTSRGQAHRVGKYALLMDRTLTDSCTFKCGLDATQSLPGHVVKVVDPLHNYSDQSVGGRLASITDTSTVTLDRPVTLDGGETYHLTVTMPDMAQSAHAVSNGSGTVTPPATISLGTAMPDTPVDGAVWTLTKDSESERLYRLLSVTDQDTKDGGFYELSGVRYIPSSITDADDPGKLEPPDLPGEDEGISAPQSLRLEEGLTATTDGVINRFIEASWQPPNTGFLHHYLVTIEHEHGTDIVEEVTEPYYQLNGVRPGLYTFDVRAVNVAGQLSTGVYASLEVSELAPIDLLSITGLELAGQGNDVVFEGRDAEFVWRLSSVTAGDLGDETFGGDTGIPDPWFQNYEVIVYDEFGVELRVDYVTDRNYIYTYEKNLEDGGPRRTIEVSVAAKDIYNRGTEESYLEVYNPPPQGYTNVTFTGGIELVVVTFTPPLDNDFVGTRVHMSQLSGYTPDDTTVMYDGSDHVVTVSGLTEDRYYLYLEGVDAFGNAGIYSQEYVVDLQTVNKIHDQLAGQIQESWLYANLNARIDLIDTPVIGLWDRVGDNETAIQNLETQGFESITTYYQPTDPQLDAHPPTLIEGDLWIDTSAGDLIKRWNGTAWDSLESAGNQIFYEDGAPSGHVNEPPPASLVKGDYWIDIHDYDGDGNPDNVPWMWTGATWANVSQGLLLATAATLNTVEAQVNDPTSGNSALAVWVESVETTASANALGIAANVVDIQYVTAVIDNPLVGTTAMATYLNTLDLAVLDQNGIVETTASNVSTLQVDITKKITTYRQDTDPANNVPAPVLVDGDLWYKTDDQMHPFRYQVSAPAGWKDIRDASATGTTTWIGTGLPDPNDAKYTTGDIYYQSDDNYKPFRFDGTTPVWDSVRDTATSGITTNVGNGVPNDAGGYNTGDLYFDALDNNHPYRYETNAWVSMLGAAGIQTYYQDAEPSGGTYADGDLWFETDQNNRVHRYDDVSTNWIDIQDGDIAAALALAQDGVDDALAAQQTADGKIVTFYQSGTPTGASEGDFWVDTTLDGNSNPINLLKRYTSSVWVAVQDQEVQDALVAAGDAQSTADGKIVTFYQDDAPTDPESSDGDLWFDTNDDNHPYRYDSTATPKWQSVKDLNPDSLKTYFETSAPTGGRYNYGDLWFDLSNDNEPHAWNNTAWVSVKDTSVTGVDTFYQDTAPGSGMVIGDLWFDTDDNNKVYRFTGSKGGWLEVVHGEYSGVVPWVQPNQPNPPVKYVGDLWIDTDDGNRPYEWNGSTWVDITTYNPDTISTTASVAVEQYARIQQDGLAFAEYSMKVDVNGHIAGIGLGVSGGQSGPIRSSIIMLADSFAIGYPTHEFQTGYTYAIGEWVTPTQAYINANGTPVVQPDGATLYEWDYVYKVTVSGFANTEPTVWPQSVGVSIVHGAKFECYDKRQTTPFIVGTFNSGSEQTPVYEDGVVIDSAFIGTATIDRTHIKDATITTAKISDLSADKITSGTLTAGQYIRIGDYHFELNANDRRLTIQDGNSYDRVELGLLSTGDYGLILRDDTDAVVLSSDGIHGSFIETASIESASIKELFAEKITGDIYELDLTNPPVRHPSTSPIAENNLYSGEIVGQTSGSPQGWYNFFQVNFTAESFDRVLAIDSIGVKTEYVFPGAATNVTLVVERELYDNGVLVPAFSGVLYSVPVDLPGPNTRTSGRSLVLTNYILTGGIEHEFILRARTWVTYSGSNQPDGKIYAISGIKRTEFSLAPAEVGVTWSAPADDDKPTP